MNRSRIIFIYLFICIAAPVHYLLGQEMVGPLRYNPVLGISKLPGQKKTARKTTATLSLPFFEDFTGYSPYPDTNKWVDFEAFINNTMGASPISRGVATLDDLNSIGIPYDSFSNTSTQYADSLTSQPIDISADSASDSVYLSFFYQAQGNGFYPTTADSLYLYLKNKYGDFVLAWAIPGDTLPPTSSQPFQQVMIPITDSLYFHNAFQFRFVNIAALDWSDAIWNVDYIRMDKNRNMYDTAINDIGFTSDPSFYLNDYTSMPYRQFFANTAGETAAQFSDSIRNNYNVFQSVTNGYSATELTTGALLHSAALSTAPISSYTTQQLTYPTYSTVIAPPSANAKVVFENTFFIQSVSPTDPPGNDTIVKDQVFDNYLAYDDGTAEKSYYLNLYPTLPGEIAIEYHLNQPDTLRGMAIYFGRQIPFAGYKSFSIMVYSALAGVNGALSDNVLREQDFYDPYYDSMNHFWMYSLDTPLVLPAGTFYAGTLQPAEGVSDSLYIGLDVNRVGGNHAYYNVIGTWNSSLVSGALMMRPLLGQSLAYLGVANPEATKEHWQALPNPAKDMLRFEFAGEQEAAYKLTDIEGRTLMQGSITNGKSIDVSPLSPGIYFVNLIFEGIPSTPQKIIKL